MMNTEIKQTIFQIEKLRNVVNVGGSSAYQIFTYTGPVLGRFGAVADSDQLIPANEAIVRTQTEVKRTASWIKSALSALQR